MGWTQGDVPVSLSLCLCLPVSTSFFYCFFFVIYIYIKKTPISNTPFCFFYVGQIVSMERNRNPWIGERDTNGEEVDPWEMGCWNET